MASKRRRTNSPQDADLTANDRPIRRMRLWNDQPQTGTPPTLSSFIDDSQPQPTDEDIFNMTPKDRRAYRQNLWLSRSTGWNGFPGVWKGISVLGQGHYGIAGLFNYIGAEPNVPKEIVVKQSGPIAGIYLRKEAAMLKELGRYGSPHVVKMFRDYYEEGGTGVHPNWDPSPWRPTRRRGETRVEYERKLEVARIYLEYCREGDAHKYFSAYRFDGGIPSVPEYHVWVLLKCLVKGLLALKNGTEDPDAEAVGVRPIAHLDLKTNNVLVGDKDATEHIRYPVIKLADFGMAKHVYPLTDANNFTNFLAAAIRAGAMGYKSPEQIFQRFHFKLNTRLDLWCAASTIYELITRHRINEQKVYTITFRGQSFTAYGKQIWHLTTYSSTLKGTLYQCLAYDADMRPRLEDLMRTIDNALQIFVTNHPNDENAAGALDLEPLTRPAGGPSINLGARPVLDANIANPVLSFDDTIADDPQTAADDARDSRNDFSAQGGGMLRFQISRFRPVVATPNLNPMAGIDSFGISSTSISGTGAGAEMGRGPSPDYGPPVSRRTVRGLLDLGGDMGVQPLDLGLGSGSGSAGATGSWNGPGSGRTAIQGGGGEAGVADVAMGGATPTQETVDAAALLLAAAQQAADQMDVDDFTAEGLGP